MDGLSPNSSAVPLIKGKSPARADESDDPEHPLLESYSRFSRSSPPRLAPSLTAAMTSGNAIGPLIALYLVFDQGSVQAEGPIPVAAGLRRGFTIESGLPSLCSSPARSGFPSATTPLKVGSGRYRLDKSETKMGARLEALQEHNISRGW
ncbi:Sodium-dependent phosphate transporter 2 [Orchesella cincta]|uniref:Sodium-dependent phosphate transporter 2 n=1 Tax=Orchesella cincta TaxID=48709 RepID=A0A1D2MBH3_ORCCI|nr:Sodium-dependent phosphate transporter 2 [Orchesella cincta]